MEIVVQRDPPSELPLQDENEEIERDEINEREIRRTQFCATIRTLALLCIGMMSFIAIVLTKKYNNPNEINMTDYPMINPDKREILTDQVVFDEDIAAQFNWAAYKEVWTTANYTHKFLSNEKEQALEAKDLQDYAKDAFEEQFNFHHPNCMYVSVGTSSTQVFKVLNGAVASAPIANGDKFGVKRDRINVPQFVSEIKIVQDSFGGKVPIIFFNAIGYEANNIIPVEDAKTMLDIGLNAKLGTYQRYHTKINTSGVIHQLHLELDKQKVANCKVKPRRHPKIEMYWAHQIALVTEMAVFDIGGGESFNGHFHDRERVEHKTKGKATNDIFIDAVKRMKSTDPEQWYGIAKECGEQIVAQVEKAKGKIDPPLNPPREFMAIQTGMMRDYGIMHDDQY